MIDILQCGGTFEGVGGLSWKQNGAVVHNPLGHMTLLNELPELPYHRVDMPKYIHANYLGRREGLTPRMFRLTPVASSPA